MGGIMKTIAVIKNDVVANKVVYSDSFIPDGKTMVDVSKTVPQPDKGWSFSGGLFTKPESIPDVHAEVAVDRIQAVEEKIDGLIKALEASGTIQTDSVKTYIEGKI